MNKYIKILWAITIAIWICILSLKVKDHFYPPKMYTHTVHFQNIDELLKEDPGNPEYLESKRILDEAWEKFKPEIMSNFEGTK